MQGFIKRCIRRLSRESGSSLIEIIVATLIVSFIAIGTVEFFAKGRFWFDQEERKRVATQLAQEAIEKTTATAYTAIANWSETRTIASVSYAIAVTVTNDQPETGMKTVRSAVTWIARGNATRTVDLTTMVTSL
jgi:type II secretory pathway pseudopilin PulG